MARSAVTKTQKARKPERRSQRRVRLTRNQRTSDSFGHVISTLQKGEFQKLLLRFGSEPCDSNHPYLSQRGCQLSVALAVPAVVRPKARPCPVLRTLPRRHVGPAGGRVAGAPLRRRRSEGGVRPGRARAYMSTNIRRDEVKLIECEFRMGGKEKEMPVPPILC
jgi:hypothetical protein